MPVSKKRKQRQSPARRSRVRRPGYLPTALPDSTDDVVERLLMMPPERLPSVGMAEWYLASSPMRTANQCAIACLTVMTVMRSLALDAEPVALILDVPNGRGGTTRYGNDSPHLEDGLCIGHVGLIADDHFIDITAAQFPEVMSHGGVRVIATPLSGQSRALLARGAVMPARLVDGFQAQYTVMPLGSADPLLMPIIASEADDLALLANNLLIGYTAVLASSPLLERLETLTTPRYAPLLDRAHWMQGKEVAADSVGRMVVQESPDR